MRSLLCLPNFHSRYSWTGPAVNYENMDIFVSTLEFFVRLALDWMRNVTCNDILVIFVTAHRCVGGLKKKFDLRPGSQRHRLFVGFFNVPVQALTQSKPFLGYSEKPLYLVDFYDTLGIRRTHSRLNPRVLTVGVFVCPRPSMV